MLMANVHVERTSRIWVVVVWKQLVRRNTAGESNCYHSLTWYMSLWFCHVGRRRRANRHRTLNDVNSLFTHHSRHSWNDVANEIHLIGDTTFIYRVSSYPPVSNNATKYLNLHFHFSYYHLNIISSCPINLFFTGNQFCFFNLNVS